nr:hypothetical protein [Maribacter aestuarii]
MAGEHVRPTVVVDVGEITTLDEYIGIGQVRYIIGIISIVVGNYLYIVVISSCHNIVETVLVIIGNGRTPLFYSADLSYVMVVEELSGCFLVMYGNIVAVVEPYDIVPSVPVHVRDGHDQAAVVVPL